MRTSPCDKGRRKGGCSMNRRRPRRSSMRQVTENERRSQLAKLRATLSRIYEKPLMGELGPVLVKMVDRGQIEFAAVRRNRTLENAFVASVHPADIAELLPLISHPAPYSTLRFFLEGLVC